MQNLFGLKLNIPSSAKLIEHIESGKCILFLGAGIHSLPPINSEYKYDSDISPLSARELSKILAEDSDFKDEFALEDETNLQRVSWYYEFKYGRKDLVDTLQKYIVHKKKPSPALEMLAQLPFRIIITTNYDQLFENALIKAGKEPQILIYNPTDKIPTTDVYSEEPSASNPLVFKIHGDLKKRDSIVITDEDYVVFVQRMSTGEHIFHPIPETIRYLLKRWPTLFIGFSLRDYNLRLLFRTLRWNIDNSDMPACFSVDPKPDPMILKVWQDKKGFVTFIIEDLWNFVPQLYKKIILRTHSWEISKTA